MKVYIKTLNCVLGKILTTLQECISKLDVRGTKSRSISNTGTGPGNNSRLSIFREILQIRNDQHHYKFI